MSTSLHLGVSQAPQVGCGTFVPKSVDKVVCPEDTNLGKEAPLNYTAGGEADCPVWDQRIVSTGTIFSSFDNSNRTNTNEAKLPRKENIEYQLPWQEYTPYTNLEPGVEKRSMKQVSKIFELVSAEQLSQQLYNRKSGEDAKTIAVSVLVKLHDTNDPVSRHLMKIAAVAGRKGREGPQLVSWYMKTFNISKTNASIRAVRDFFSCIYAWQFVDVANPKLLDAAAAMFCLTTAIDYAGAKDDAQCGDQQIYLTAVADGVRALQGRQPFQKALSGIIATCGFMLVRDAIKMEVEGMENLVAIVNASLSPERFFQLRWWDAAMVPYHCLVMGIEDTGVSCDRDGLPFCVDKCHRIKRAVDVIIRYSDLLDIISDAAIGEAFNDPLVAFTFGGAKAVEGYAEAQMAIIEEVIDCPCNADGHAWAGSLAVGSCAWYAIVPRYQMFTQLKAATLWRREVQGEPAMPEKEGEFLPGLKKLCGFVQDGNMLHTQNWSPMWSPSMPYTAELGTGHCSACCGAISVTAKRILTLPQGTPSHTKLCLALSKILQCQGGPNKKCTFRYEAKEYAGIWEQLLVKLYNFETSVEAPTVETDLAAAAVYKFVKHYCLATWWPVAGNDEDDIAIEVDIFTSYDIAMRATYDSKSSSDGAWRRHLLIGLAATFLEFSPVRAYASVCEYAFGLQRFI